jgi:hypothetical protein
MNTKNTVITILAALTAVIFAAGCNLQNPSTPIVTVYPLECKTTSLNAASPAYFTGEGTPSGDYVIRNTSDYYSHIMSGLIVPICMTCTAGPDFTKKMLIAVSGGMSTCGWPTITITSVKADCNSITVTVRYGPVACPTPCPLCPCITVISYPGFAVEVDQSDLPVHFENVSCVPDPDSDGDGRTDYQEMFGDLTDPFNAYNHI